MGSSHRPPRLRPCDVRPRRHTSTVNICAACHRSPSAPSVSAQCSVSQIREIIKPFGSRQRYETARRVVVPGPPDRVSRVQRRATGPDTLLRYISKKQNPRPLVKLVVTCRTFRFLSAPANTTNVERPSTHLVLDTTVDSRGDTTLAVTTQYEYEYMRICLYAPRRSPGGVRVQS
jgi:hypothetical protein